MHPLSFAKTGAGAGATTICDVPHLGSFLGAFGEGVGCAGDKADSRKCPCHFCCLISTMDFCSAFSGV